MLYCPLLYVCWMCTIHGQNIQFILASLTGLLRCLCNWTTNKHWPFFHFFSPAQSCFGQYWADLYFCWVIYLCIQRNTPPHSHHISSKINIFSYHPLLWIFTKIKQGFKKLTWRAAEVFLLYGYTQTCHICRM